MESRSGEGRDRRLLVLGAGAAQLGLLEAARARGLLVVVADADPAAPGFRLASRRALVSSEDEEAIERLTVAEGVHGLVAPGTDWPVAIAARVAERLGLPHPISSATAALAVSKLRQRARLREAGVRQPAYTVARRAGADDAARAWRDAGGPAAGAVVAKPADRQGQQGLGVARSPAELCGALAAALAASRGGVALVEALLPGREVTVNAFSADGTFVPVAVTDRETDPGRAFGVALAHVWPSALPGAHVEAATREAAAAARALGVAHGPTYTQVVVDPEGRAHVVELAARLGGGHDGELCAAAVGVDVAALAVRSALGDPVDADEARPRAQDGVGGAVTRFLVVERPGALRAVEGVAEAEALPGVRRVRLYRDAGAELGALRRGNDRHGAVLATGATRTEALQRAARAVEAIRFVVSDGRPDPA